MNNDDTVNNEKNYYDIRHIGGDKTDDDEDDDNGDNTDNNQNDDDNDDDDGNDDDGSIAVWLSRVYESHNNERHFGICIESEVE